MKKSYLKPLIDVEYCYDNILSGSGSEQVNINKLSIFTLDDYEEEFYFEEFEYKGGKDDDGSHGDFN